MREIIKYKAQDGKEFDSKSKCREYECEITNRKFECPKCKGSGEVAEGNLIYGTVTNPNYGWGGFYDSTPPTIQEAIGREVVDCNLCQGFGKTKEEKKPIIREEVIGYE